MKSMYSLLAVGIFSLMSVGVVGAEGDVASTMNPTMSSSANAGTMVTQPAPVSSSVRSDVSATRVLTETQLTCVRTAVAKREAAIGAGWSTFSSAMASAYSARATALNEAWMTTDSAARKQLRDAAWSAYKSSSTAAKTTARNTRKSAWTTFRTEASACRVSPTELDTAQMVSDTLN